jgi:ArsR family transcriptional regulator
VEKKTLILGKCVWLRGIYRAKKDPGFLCVNSGHLGLLATKIRRNKKMKIFDELRLNGEDEIERASRSLRAMSHPLRLKILCTLCDNERSVQDIVDQVGTSQSNISQHLAILRDKDIIASRKDANRVFYRLEDQRTVGLINMARELFISEGDVRPQD